MSKVNLDGEHLTIDDLCRIMDGLACAVPEHVLARMKENAEWYTNNTPKGLLRGKWEWLVGGEPPQTEEGLIHGFILSHCSAVGPPLEEALVRGVMAARINVLAKSMSGVRPAVVRRYVTMLNEGIVPIIPSKGTNGTAGSTILAHIVRVAFGWGGHALVSGVSVPAKQAVSHMEPVEPNEKEALSLVNGDTLSVALGARGCHRAGRILNTAEAAAALSFEVVRADRSCLSTDAISARGHRGAIGVAERLRVMLEGSELCHEERRPDPFSIRCTPAVLGAAHDALEHARLTVETELNGAVDNPLIITGGQHVETGNFHGAALAMVMDYLKLAMVQVASIAERRVFRMTYGQLSGLPSFLVPGTGLNSGLMLAQYTAASLVSECKGLAFPASVDSIPVVQHREDHAPMSPIAGASLLRILDAVTNVLAIELLCGAQGLEFHLEGHTKETPFGQHGLPKNPGKAAIDVWTTVRDRVSRWEDDRVLHTDLNVLGEAVRQGHFSMKVGPW